MKNKKIAVIGGSFNPVHMGHMAVGEAAQKELCPQKVIFIPSYIHPDKGKPLGATFEQRFYMLQLAVATKEDWEVSEIEYKQNRTSYTVNTLTELKKTLCENSEIYFVCGADIIYTVHTWRDPQRLFRICKFAVVQRPGFMSNDFLAQVKEVEKRYDGFISIIECEQMDISSSDIRNRIKGNVSVKGLVPEPVEEYIRKNRLYQN